MRLGILGIDCYQMVKMTLALGKSLIFHLEVTFHSSFQELIPQFLSQVPEDSLGEPRNNSLSDYRIRLETSVSVPEHQSAKGPGSEWCHTD